MKDLTVLQISTENQTFAFTFYPFIYKSDNAWVKYLIAA